MDPPTLLSLLGSAESLSEHPLARAVQSYAAKTLEGKVGGAGGGKDVEWVQAVSEFEAIAGGGVKCRVGGTLVIVRRGWGGAGVGTGGWALDLETSPAIVLRFEGYMNS